MATFNFIPRTSANGRIAFVALVSFEVLTLSLCGCHSPWRILRKNEPSLEELLASSERWDAESRLAEQAIGPRGDVTAGTNRKGSRANPYAARNMAAKASPAERQEQGAEGFSEADFAEAYAAAPPHLRPLLKRQWEATQSAATQSKTALRDDVGAETPGTAVAGDQRRELQPLASGSRTAPRRGINSSTDRDRAHRDDSNSRIGRDIGDKDFADKDFADEDVAGRDIDGNAVAEEDVGVTKAIAGIDRSLRKDASAARTAQDDGSIRFGSAGRNPATRVVPASYAEDTATEPVRFSLSDEGEAVEPLPAPPEDLKPPAEKRTSRQIAHADPIDTGMSEQVSVQPATRKPRDVQPAAAAKTDAHSGGSVAPALAQQSQPKSDKLAAASLAASTLPTSGPAVGSAELPAAATSATELSWHDHLREALRQLETENADSSASPSEQLNGRAVSRMVHLALGELEPALKPIEGLQPAEQDFFRHQFQALHDAIDPRGNPVLARRWTLVMDSQRRATSHLGAVSNLEIKNAAFCSNVDGFGSVTKFPSASFRTKQEVLLYCELENFVSLPVKDGFQTILQGSYEIVDANGHRVFEALLSEDSDICRHQRRDYFIAYRIYMPDNLQAGRYQLRLTIEDMKGRKFGQSALDFQIAQ